MPRSVSDEAYLRYLQPGLFRNRYLRWKVNMLEQIDRIVEDLGCNTIEDVMVKYNLTPKDMALLVRLKYFTEKEIEEYGLAVVSDSVPM